MGWKLPRIQAATIISVVAITISGASLIYSKRSYDLSAARDEREMMDKLPALDVQIRPDGATSAALTISIANRGDINIVPLDITAEHSFEAGELYLSSAQQSANRLKTSLSLTSMGTIAPKGVGNLKARLFGATDEKDDRCLLLLASRARRRGHSCRGRPIAYEALATTRSSSAPLRSPRDWFLANRDRRGIMADAPSENHLWRNALWRRPDRHLVYCAHYRCSHSIAISAD
jgi:hypothetical protein